MVYAVYTTETFEKEISKLSEKDRKIIEKVFLQLKYNPYAGDSIRYRFFREKKIKEKRVYYIVYDDLSAVLIVGFGGKKEQQKTIEKVVRYLPEFKEYLKKILKDN